MRRLAVALLSLAATAGLCTAAPAGADPAPPDALHAPVQVAHTRDGDVGYRVVGQGSPLVLITGFAGSIDLWSPRLLDALGEHHRVYAIDNAGVGQTSALPSPLTIDAMADQTAAFVRTERLGRADVFGWSMGGMIAQSLAVRHPQLVRRLVLAATQTGDGRSAPTPPGAGGALGSGDLAKAVAVLFPADQLAAAQAWGREIVQYPGFYTASKTAIAQQWPTVPDWIAGTYLTGHLTPFVLAPTLVLDGAQDALDPPGNLDLLVHTLPFARGHRYPDAGHAFMMQEPQEVAADVDAFLR